MDLQIRFCTSADGTRIGYGLLGQGPPLVAVESFGCTAEADWDNPACRATYQRLSEGRQFTVMMRRGYGPSQRDVGDLSLEAQVADIDAVVNSLGAERVDLWGFGDSAATCVAFAADNPDKVARLLLWDVYAKGSELTSSEAVDALIQLVRSDWSLARRAMANSIFPRGPVEEQRWFSGQWRDSISPDVAARYLEFMFSVDLTSFLPRVQAPTLVLHRRASRMSPPDNVRAAAALVPNARFLALDGDISYAWLGDTSYLESVKAFLDEGRDKPQASTPGLGDVRPSGAVVILFTDIVNSTALTEEMGDAAFRERARVLDASLRELVRETGGVPIEGALLGDGLLAVFTSARQGVECGLRCHDVARETGLELHVGLHAGDVIREGNNIYGGAVNLAARVRDAAEAGVVVVSSTVRDLARTSATVRFLDRGEHTLKGIADPVRLYQVVPAGEP